MSKENKADLFIPRIPEALEIERVIRKHGFSFRSRAYAKRYGQIFLSGRKYTPGSNRSQDCVQMMSDTPLEQRFG
ncbi:hypothetical protein [Paracoccus salsus]|uniref:hypothetical protein n=1 Tax=Paracoccus salsus TaxID=2911061 RepID=UPI001F3EEF6C|nr:hypothetical protein [Paracoccus salsus]MCF3974981.1 hypothetical protein [Paracoccus salsus]